jgi:SAM-dependent methyltransferase
MANEFAINASFEFLPLRFAQNYRAALLKTFRPYLGGRVVEIGAGIGQFTQLLKGLPTIQELLAVEPEAQFCEALTQHLPKESVICGTASQLTTEADALVSINVLEHIADDQSELEVYHRLLRQRKGCLCLLVPARKEIYAPIDRAFGHYRRYGRTELSDKLKAAQFEVQKIYYFNFMGYFGWWLVFCLLKQCQFNERSVRFFDRFIFPTVFWWETCLCRPPLGQSLVAIARAGTRLH